MLSNQMLKTTNNWLLLNSSLAAQSVTIPVHLIFQRGWTPLIMAAKGGYTEVVECLLERDPHINATDQVSVQTFSLPQCSGVSSDDGDIHETQINFDSTNSTRLGFIV